MAVDHVNPSATHEIPGSLQLTCGDQRHCPPPDTMVSSTVNLVPVTYGICAITSGRWTQSLHSCPDMSNDADQILANSQHPLYLLADRGAQWKRGSIGCPVRTAYGVRSGTKLIQDPIASFYHRYYPIAK